MNILNNKNIVPIGLLDDGIYPNKSNSKIVYIYYRRNGHLYMYRTSDNIEVDLTLLSSYDNVVLYSLTNESNIENLNIEDFLYSNIISDIALYRYDYPRKSSKFIYTLIPVSHTIQTILLNDIDITNMFSMKGIYERDGFNYYIYQSNTEIELDVNNIIRTVLLPIPNNYKNFNYFKEGIRDKEHFDLNVIRVSKNEIDSIPIVDKQLIFEYDTNTIYLDNNLKRVPYNFKTDDDDLENTIINDVPVIREKTTKTYNPENYSGMGRIILRKNMIEGVNVLTQSMINQANTIYEIRYDFDLNGKEITIPEGCVLQFEGGSISNGSMKGTNTYIVSPLYYIFRNVTLSGFFSNAEGYVEWFGAKAYSEPITYDCAPYINKAFDSPFGIIVFQNGCYYLASTIVLKRVKTILMNGKGSRGIDMSKPTNIYPVNNHTCLWVDSNIDIFEVNLNGDDFIRDRHDDIRLIIKGGCLNASMASEKGDKVYNKTALLIKLPVWGMINSEINTSMARSTYYDGKLDDSNVDNRGNGVWFTDNGKLINAAGVDRKGANFIQDITVDCTGFTHGVLVDYNPLYGDMTHLMVHGYFDSCIKDIYINSYAITYGLIDATIQTGGVFRKGEDVNKYPHISGNLNRCKIDSIFWDINNKYHSPIAIDATRTSNLILGDRARNTLNNNNIIGGGAFYYTLHQKAIHPLLDANRLGFTNASGRDNYLKLIDNSLLDVAKRKTVEISIDSNLDILNKDDLDASSLFSNLLEINLNNPQSSEDAYLNMKVTFSTVEQIVGLYLHTALGNSVTRFNNISIEVYNGADELVSSNYDSALKDRDLPGLSDFIIPAFIEGFYNNRQIKYIIIKMRGLVVSSQNYIRLSLEGGAQGAHSHMITSLGGTVYEDLDLKKMLLQGNRVNYDSKKSSLTIGDTVFTNESPLNRQFLRKTNTEGTSHIKLFNVPRQFFGTFIITTSTAMFSNACYVVIVYKGYNGAPTYIIKELYRGDRYDFVTFKSTEPIINGDNSLVISTNSNTQVSRVYVADYMDDYYNFGDLEFMDDSTWESLPNTVEISKYTTLNTTTTEGRPAYADKGVQYFDTTLNKPIWWTGSKWVNTNGYNADIKTYGTFSQKPLSSDGIKIGFEYFCTDKQTTEGATNGIIIYHKGNDIWVDALGRVV